MTDRSPRTDLGILHAQAKEAALETMKSVAFLRGYDKGWRDASVWSWVWFATTVIFLIGFLWAVFA